MLAGLEEDHRPTGGGLPPASQNHSPHSGSLHTSHLCGPLCHLCVSWVTISKLALDLPQQIQNPCKPTPKSLAFEGEVKGTQHPEVRVFTLDGEHSRVVPGPGKQGPAEPQVVQEAERKEEEGS